MNMPFRVLQGSEYQYKTQSMDSTFVYIDYADVDRPLTDWNLIPAKRTKVRQTLLGLLRPRETDAKAYNISCPSMERVESKTLADFAEIAAGSPLWSVTASNGIRVPNELAEWRGLCQTAADYPRSIPRLRHYVETLWPTLNPMGLTLSSFYKSILHMREDSVDELSKMPDFRWITSKLPPSTNDFSFTVGREMERYRPDQMEPERATDFLASIRLLASLNPVA